MDSPHNSTE